MKSLDASLKRVLISGLGTHGDLFPALALGREFRRNGFQVTIGTNPDYRERVLKEEFRFAELGGTLSNLTPEEWEKATTSRTSSRFVYRDYVIPNTGAMLEQLERAGNFDLYVNHPLAMAVPLIAEKRGIPWISYSLAPISMFSSEDGSVLDGLPFGFASDRALSPFWHRIALAAADRVTSRWTKPIHKLREELRLPKVANPILRGQYSPFGTWALFSEEFQKPQADWPSLSHQLGFPLYREAEAKLSLECSTFLDRFERPIVFTLGTAAVRSRPDFFREVALELKSRKIPAILLAGESARQTLALSGEDGILVTPAEPHHLLFPRASVIAHSCGIGTSAEALASGVPQIPVPFANDQPDNAYRIEKLGVGVRIPWRRFTSARFFEALSLVSTQAHIDRASVVGESIRMNDFSRRFDLALEAFRQ